ncbi:MAG: hypothetical protein JOZ26_21440 [Hyphomicrobiales bacterium]|nr:hypothetical protein [Hyphomicrobiales bacterium]
MSAGANASIGTLTNSGQIDGAVELLAGWGEGKVKWPRAAGPYLAAAKLEERLLIVLYQAAKVFVCC